MTAGAKGAVSIAVSGPERKMKAKGFDSWSKGARIWGFCEDDDVKTFLFCFIFSKTFLFCFISYLLTYYSTYDSTAATCTQAL